MSYRKRVTQISMHIAGVRVTASTSHQDYLASLYSYYQLCHDPGGIAHPIKEIQVELQKVGNAFIIWCDSDRIVLTDCREVVPLLIHLIEHVIRDAISSKYYLIHAASLSFKGKGVLLPGLRGQGKTTLSTALISRGFDYLADDVTQIDLSNRQIVPFPTSLKIKGDTEWTKSLLDQHWHRTLTGGRIWFVSPLRVRRNCISGACPVNYIFFLERTAEGRGNLKSIGKAKAFLELLKITHNSLKRHGLRGFDLVEWLVRGAECYVLSVNDLTEGLKMIEQVVSD